MAIGDYGFSALNRSQNSNIRSNISLGNSSNFLITNRVKSIVLDSTYPNFENIGGWNTLGCITTYENDSLILPLYPNIKNYPLINEIVYIIEGKGNNIIGTPDKNELISQPNLSYYITATNIFNNPHNNAYPFSLNTPPLPSLNQIDSKIENYLKSEAGNTNIPTTQPSKIYLGKTFKERSNIHPLLPFEGDIIYEGRWGNSIRLGSTVKDTPNNWSATGENGDPITIIRNGQGIQSEEGWIPIVENINNSDSSITLTSTQQVPLQASSTSYISYSTPPTSPNKYSGKQILLNSDRLVFNSNQDHILLSSAKSINLNSVESVNIDTKKFITQADQIFLGKEDLANQPLMLGNNTVDLLKNLTSVVKELTNTLKTLQSAPVAPGSPAVFPTLLAPMSQLVLTLESLENQLDKGVLTSKRNFTL